MSCYSVHCVLSGLPISCGEPVVGWSLQKSKFEDDEKQYIPKSLPVIGLYDTYGGIEDNDGNCILRGSGMEAICHFDLWNALPQFWNEKDGERSEIGRAHV